MISSASRAALAAAALIAVLSLAAGPASARRAPDPTVTPTPLPLHDITSPPPTVAAANAADACANDAFLSYRTVPAPFQQEVTICGIVSDGALAAPVSTRGAAAAAFYVDADGSQPIAVAWNGAGAPSAHVGDLVVARGRYHRDNGGGEGIDGVRSTPARGWPFDGYVMINGTMYR